MKGLILALLVCGVASEGPYAPSGWRPNGPSFELPERAPVDPRNRNPQKQEYLPPNAPRTPTQEYGPPEVDVSVQGLPTQEQLPIFQLSPVNGQQYVGPSFNHDLKTLRSSQIQTQQRINREFARQRELEAAFANANRQNQPSPRQFASNPTTPKIEIRTTTVETTTEALKLNQGEVDNGKDNKENVTVEVSKQNIQEYPPELFLTPLAQLQLQNQYNPVQLGQLRAPIYLEPSQNYQAQLQALPAYLAQQQLLQAQLAQTQAQLVQAQAQLVQPQVEQQAIAPSPAYLVSQDQAALIPQQQGVPVQYQPANQYAPANQYDSAQIYPQQPIFLQPQENQLLPRPKDQQVAEQDQAQQVQPQNQFVYQYQPQYQDPQLQQSQLQQPQYQQPQLQQPQYQQPQSQQPQYQQPQFQQPQYQQPQSQQPQYQQPQYQQPQYQQPQLQQPQYQQPQYQIQYQQPLTSYQQDLVQPQIFVQDPQLSQQQAQQPRNSPQNGSPTQNSLQSGFDANQQGNGLETEDKDDEQDDGSTATAVATAFGTRTQPRTSYGVPVPRVQGNPGYQYPATEQTTTEAVTEDSPADAKTRRPAKLRNRQSRVRPVFTLDRSGHLVLAQDH
ncbi:hypothetical protein O0L34_g18738 [Tuta absoluta]|nr:hypothetical protein O0L34_g18738 [Tuta absoluta]